MDEQVVDTLSPLYCAYNGFMLGQFLHQLHLPYTEKEYLRTRRRMREFLREVEVENRLPAAPEEFLDYVNTEPLDTWQQDLYAKSLRLGHYCFLGVASSEFFMTRALGNEPDPEETEALFARSEQLGVPARIIEKIAGALPENPEHADVNTADYLGVSLRYLAELLGHVPNDDQAVFVVMPFADRFLDRWGSFYMPAAANAGYHAIRAWGGLDVEVFSNTLATLINKCDWVLADVSTLNPNVMYEVGLAHGLDKDVILVTETDQLEVPANLGEFWVRPYYPEVEAWQEEAIAAVNVMITTTKLAYKLRDEDGFPRELSDVVGEPAAEDDA